MHHCGVSNFYSQPVLDSGQQAHMTLNLLLMLVSQVIQFTLLRQYQTQLISLYQQPLFKMDI